MAKLIVLVLLFFSADANALCFFFNCGSGFVRLREAAQVADKDASVGVAPSDGYLRVHVTSNTDAIVANEQFQHLDTGLKYLSVTMKLAVNGKESAEMPVLLYDLQQRNEVRMDNASVFDPQYIDVANGALEPSVEFHVRAIPTSIAEAYFRAINKVSSYASSGKSGPLSSAAPEVVVAADVLNSFTSDLLDAQNKDWNSTIKVGINSRTDGVMPLNGKAKILFLVPTSSSPEDSAIEESPVTLSANHVIDSQGRQILFPFLAVKSEIVDYQALAPRFVSSKLSCNTTARQLDEYEAALRAIQLTNIQAKYEDYLVRRARLLVDVNSQKGIESFEQIADVTMRFLNLRGGSDAYWKDHYAVDASSLEACITDTFNNSLGSARQWQIMQAAIQAALKFTQSPDTPNASNWTEDSLEHALDDVVRPIQAFGLKTGSQYAVLVEARERIESQLASTVILNAQVNATYSQRAAMRISILNRIASTNCRPCTMKYRAALNLIAVRDQGDDAQASPAVAIDRLKIYSLEGDLAEKLSVADAVLQAALNLPSPDQGIDSLKETEDQARNVLGQDQPGIATLQSVTAEVVAGTEKIVDELRSKSPSTVTASVDGSGLLLANDE